MLYWVHQSLPAAESDHLDPRPPVLRGSHATRGVFLGACNGPTLARRANNPPAIQTPLGKLLSLFNVGFTEVVQTVGGRREKELISSCYTVITRMIPALRWAAT